MKSVCFLIIILLSCSISGQDFAVKNLEESPRHMEWITLVHDDREVKCFQVYPEINTKAPGIIVIHENRGLTDWIRSTTDQLAAHGLIAVAPDLLTGHGPNGGDTKNFANMDIAREAIYELDQDQIISDLNAVFKSLKETPSCNGKIAIIGFCWGGSQVYQYLMSNVEVVAGFVFYGTSPKSKKELDKIRTPVYGFYGEFDSRVTSTIWDTDKKMKELGKKYEPVIFEEGGHGFMRSGERPGANDGNIKARTAAWRRLIPLLEEI